MPHAVGHPTTISESQWDAMASTGTPTGNISYDELSYLQQSGDLSKYLSKTWGLGGQYAKYITDLEQKPFEMMKEAAGQQIGQASSATQAQLRQTYSQEAKAAGKAGFATSGGIANAMNLQKEQLLGGFQQDVSGVQLGLEKDVYGEQQRQQERFFDEIGAIKQMQSSDGGGGKK